MFRKDFRIPDPLGSWERQDLPLERQSHTKNRFENMDESRSVRVEHSTPYVLMGFHLMEIMAALKSMPRSTEAICLHIEDILSNAQVLQQDQVAPEPVTPPNI